MTWIARKIAERLGGPVFDAQPSYKFEAIKEAKRRFRQKNPERLLLDFGVGEPDGQPPLCAVRELQKVCGLPEYQGYADNGADFFKDAALRYLANVFQVTSLTPEQYLPIIGIKSGLGLLAGTLINPGDWVAFPTPSYGVFGTQARYFQGKIYPIPLTEDHHFLPQLHRIPEDIRAKIKVFYLNYPHNPTGAVATRAFFEEIVQWAQTYHWVLIHDAAYSALDFDKPLSILQVPGAEACGVELHSLSKGFNMTGWRCAWMCGNATLIRACSMYKDNCDSGQYLGLQKAAAVALDQSGTWLPVLRQHYQKRLQLLAETLKKYGFRPFPSFAGFFLYMPSPTQVHCTQTQQTWSFASAADCAAWLLDQCGIVVVPWDENGTYLRFSATFKLDEFSLFQHLQQRLSSYIFSCPQL